MNGSMKKKRMNRMPRHGGFCLLALAVACVLAWPGALRGQGSETVNWIGGNLMKIWNDEANWSPSVIPLNGSDIGYTVIVPDSSSISYLFGGDGAISALSIGDGSVLDISEGSVLRVEGVGVIRGMIKVFGSDSNFTAPGGDVVLERHPQF